MRHKLCIDCRWYEANKVSSPDINLDRCTRPGAVWATVDLVRGEHLPAFAVNERTHVSRPNPCGLEAKFWEPHPDTFTTTEEADDGNPSF